MVGNQADEDDLDAGETMNVEVDPRRDARRPAARLSRPARRRLAGRLRRPQCRPRLGRRPRRHRRESPPRGRGGRAGRALVTVHQVHSPEAVYADRALARRRPARRPTRSSPTAPASRSASSPPIARRCCSPTGEAGVIAAAHAGWKGAFGGVVEATLALMERLGADRARIAAAIGPVHRPQILRGRRGLPAPLRRGRSRERALLHARPRGPSPVRPRSLCPRPPRRRRASPAPRRSASTPIPSPDRFYSLPPRHPPRRARLRPPDLADRLAARVILTEAGSMNTERAGLAVRVHGCRIKSSMTEGGETIGWKPAPRIG